MVVLLHPPVKSGQALAMRQSIQLSYSSETQQVTYLCADSSSKCSEQPGGGSFQREKYRAYRNEALVV